MVVPPPLSDPSHIETRLLVVAEMLEQAVAEVRRAMAEIKDGTTVSVEVTEKVTKTEIVARKETGSTDDH